MSGRIDRLKQTIKNNIAARKAGFLETIPSIRDLVELLGESRHVVNAALKELENEKVLICKPQKGFQINPAVKPGIAESIEIVFTENLRWQTAHWTRMVHNFEQLHPQYKVTPRFISDIAKVSEHIDSCRGKPVVIVHTPPELLSGGGHFIPIPEIERILGEPPAAVMMPGLEHFHSNNSLPYILQPPMLLIRKNRAEDTPDLDSWQHLFQWCSKEFGGQSVLPINTELLLQRIGLCRKVTPNEEQLRSYLATVAGLMRFVRKQKLYYVDLLSQDNFSQVRKILDEPLRVLNRNSFYYGAVAEFCKDRMIELYPPPLEKDGCIDVPVCQLSIAGSTCTQGSARLFQYILGRDNQTAMLKEFLGISPFRCWNQQVLEHPEEYPVNLDRIIRQLLEVPASQLLYEYQKKTDLQEFINCLVTDRLILPLLSGELTGREREQQEIDYICRTIVEKDHEINREHYVKSLRKQLLGD